MKDLTEFLHSGVLELYILGLASVEENQLVHQMIRRYPEIESEIDASIESLLSYSKLKVPRPRTDIKAMLMGTIDYTERLINGEAPSFPKALNAHSKIEDYAEWLNRKDLDLSQSTEEIELKIIGSEPEKTTAIVTIKTETPYEIHDKEIEKFLIVEGSCNIVTDEKIYTLVAGDYYEVPLHLGHVVKVTSKIPCKVILQRVAA
jgi:mannose-6-phosphate isomerase-like protein (cupin superfamily)